MARFNSILFVFFVPLYLFGQSFPDPAVDSLMRAGINNIVIQNYDEAGKVFTQLDEKNPELPLGKIYLAALKIAEAYDYAEEFDREYIEEKLQAAKEQSEKLLNDEPDNLWFNYFYALTEGYISYFNALNGDWFDALSEGMNSIEKFEQCLSIDPQFYEAYIAIGTFEYWKSRRTEFLNWLPFYEDDREAGIEKLRTAIKFASYNSYLAVNSLIWIYIDQKNFSSAVELGEKVLTEFPGSRYFKWGLARAYEEIDPEKSIRFYNEILNSYSSDRKSNHVNEIILKHLIAQQSVKTGDKETALRLCNEILQINNLNDYAKDKLADRLERVEELKDSLLKEKNFTD